MDVAIRIMMTKVNDFTPFLCELPQKLRPKALLAAGPKSILVILSVCLVCLVLYRLFFHPLAHIPGPLFARASGWWRTSRYFRGTWHDDILEVHRKYGPIVRIAPNELSVVNAHVTKQLYGHGHNAKKTTWYNTWYVPIKAPMLFMEQDKKLHAFLRKRVSSAYSMTAVLKMERYIQECLDLLLWGLKDHAEKGHVVNMSDWTNAFAFDVVGELAYGQQLGHLRTESDVNDLRKGIFNGFFVMANFGHFPLQAGLVNNPFMNGLMKVLGKPNPFLAFQEWTTERVKHRMDGHSHVHREDMLTHFTCMKSAEGRSATFDEVMAEALNIISAGADTTSIGMRTCLYYFCNHPKVYEKIQADVDTYYKTNNVQDPITYQQTQQIPYLTAAVKEALRLLPSIVYQLVRYAPDGLSIDGKSIPPGTPVGVSPIAQNRDPAVFGPDPDAFRPERWLESLEKANAMESINMTFGGSGPRMCIGRNIALVEIHKFIAQLLHNFDVRLANPEKPWHITSYWFAYQHDMHMWIKKRPQAALKRPDTKKA